MNNFTFGDEGMGYYETIAGGAGAGPGWHGRSGVHTHMTNTRITGEWGCSGAAAASGRRAWSTHSQSAEAHSVQRGGSVCANAPPSTPRGDTHSRARCRRCCWLLNARP